ncbi:hypothetical protein ACF053_29565 [Streptomyces kanasensis]|uniref:hypothetical protein n=1 Tax=Streptomyces kanasensis TaxID=936756 RepID=UPI0036FFC878
MRQSTTPKTGGERMAVGHRSAVRAAGAHPLRIPGPVFGAELETWLPSEGGTMRLGVGAFDLVVTAASVDALFAVQVMSRIQPGGCGPVIDAEDWLCWLVPPGTIRHWMDHPFGLCLSGPVEFAVPPQARREGPGRFWLRPPVRHFTDPSLLRRVLWRYQPAPSPHDVDLPGILSRSVERQ